MSRFVILLSGPLEPTARLKSELAGARVIAAAGETQAVDPTG